MKKAEIVKNGRHNRRDATTAINFDSDWRYIRITNTSSYDKEFTSLSYDDREWESIQLPHNVDKKAQKFTSTCVSYWYRKRFDLRQKYDKHQHIYLHFESVTDDDADSDMKIPAVTIWLNENQLFSNTLPEPIDLTQYLTNDSENLLVIYSKHGYRLRLHARLILPRRLSCQIDLDELPENDSQGRGSTLDYTASFDDSD
jgi:beta-galactosidase